MSDKPKKGNRLLQYAGYLAVRVMICVLQALRIETCERLAGWLATLAVYIIPVRRTVIDDNLRSAFPHLSANQRRRLAWGMWRHLVLLVVEVAHLPRKIHETNWRDYVTLGNPDWMVRRLLAPRPFVIVTGHFGNFEAGGYVLGVLGFPTSTVARALDNPYLDRFVNEFRSRTGQKIIAKKGGSDEIIEIVSGGGTLTLLADQYAGEKGLWVDFFGRPASTFKAIALLSLQQEAPLAVGITTRRERPLHFHLACHAVSDPRENPPECANPRTLTQWYTHLLEGAIRRNPEQYWWVHRRWKDTRPAKKKAA